VLMRIVKATLINHSKKCFQKTKMEIKNSTAIDIPEIFRLYNLASAYQRSKQTVVVWPEFEKELVETEVAEKRQWKMMIDGDSLCLGNYF